MSALLADLASEHAATRDAAVARLTVIGGRAVGRLASLARDTRVAPTTRGAAFHALAGIADPRGLEPALEALAQADEGVAIAAIGVARAFLETTQGMAALDRLTALILDRRRSSAARLAALRALSDLDATTVKPLMAALEGDPDRAVAEAAALRQRSAAVDPVQRLEDAARGSLGNDPAALRQAVMEASSDVSVSTLLQILEEIRVREGSEPAGERVQWMAARAAAHAALARRGSRIALHDLRETLESAKEPVSIDFLAAATTVGDASCLDAIAAAFARSAPGASSRDWWHTHLAETFRAIVKREGLTRHHALVRKIGKRWKPALDALWPGP